jgi:hypothetical protein
MKTTTKQAHSAQTSIFGRPFVSHVDQDARPQITDVKDFLARKYISVCIDNNILQHGQFKQMGYIFNLQPYLNKYVYKQYGRWHEAYAPNKTSLRRVIYGTIDKIIQL